MFCFLILTELLYVLSVGPGTNLPWDGVLKVVSDLFVGGLSLFVPQPKLLGCTSILAELNRFLFG